MKKRKEQLETGAPYRQCEQAVRQHIDWLMELPHVVGVGVCEEPGGFAVALYVEQVPSKVDKGELRPPPVLVLKQTGDRVPVRCFNTAGPIRLVRRS